MMLVKKSLHDAAGKLCKALLPIKYGYFLGGGKALAICTLSSIHLLEKISRSEMMSELVIAGRLLSENKGIDAMIYFTLKHPDLNRMVICGKEVKGHRAGQAVLALARNGMDLSGRIIGAAGPYPILKSPAQDVDAFRRQVEIIDMIGTVDIDKIAGLLVA
jgi:tetrahydromethanopterin S-methyltransferase subunit A